jgi:release factor glutamine methyltransferase
MISTCRLKYHRQVVSRLEPLQYIIGDQPFGPLNIITRPPVLIPRPETEEWSFSLSSLFNPSPSNPLSLLDLCTGTGCIPLLLCHLWPKGSVRAYGVDISPNAINLAKENADVHSLSHAFTPILADIRDPRFLRNLNTPFDIITANPPYIPKSEYDHHLSPCVKDYEDPIALIGGPDGLSFYHAIARLIATTNILKKNGGLVALEVGDGQANAVQQIIRSEARLSDIEIWKDAWGKNRTVVARHL